MSKLFRILTVAVLATALLVSSQALAGPGKGETGDPDSPQGVGPRNPASQDLGDSYGKGIEQGRTKQVEARDHWLRLLSRYFRALRHWVI
jgi:hypothetical protein